MEDNIFIVRMKRQSVLVELWFFTIPITICEVVSLLQHDIWFSVGIPLFSYFFYLEPTLKELKLSGREYIVIDENGMSFQKKRTKPDTEFIPWTDIVELKVVSPRNAGNEDYMKLETTERKYIILLPWTLDKSTKEIKKFIANYYNAK